MDVASHYADMNASHGGEAKVLECNSSQGNKMTLGLSSRQLEMPAGPPVSGSKSSSIVGRLMHGFITYVLLTVNLPHRAECSAEAVDVKLQWIGINWKSWKLSLGIIGNDWN